MTFHFASSILMSKRTAHTSPQHKRNHEVHRSSWTV